LGGRGESASRGGESGFIQQHQESDGSKKGSTNEKRKGSGGEGGKKKLTEGLVFVRFILKKKPIRGN